MIKIIILDDEPLIREGILEIVDWDELGITVCATGENGIEGIELVKKYEPDLILTDIMMPGMNGLEFLEWVHDYDPEIRSMILTGYQDFDFARKAISLGVTDFILKPTKLDDLLEPLKNNVHIIQEKRHKQERQEIIKAQLEQSRSLIQTTYINGLLFNPYINYDEVSRELDYYKIALHHYVVVLIEIDYLDQLLHNDKKIEDHLLTTHYLQRCFEDQHIRHISFVNPRDFNQIISVLSLESNDESHYNKLIHTLGELNQHLKEYALKASLGVSHGQSDLRTMGESYHQAKVALDYASFLGNNSLVTYENCQSFKVSQPNLINNLPDEIFSALQGCKKEKYQRCLLHFIYRLENTHHKQDVINLCMQMHLQLSHFLGTHIKKMTKEDQDLYSYERMIQRLSSKMDAIAYIKKCLDRAIGLVEAEQSNTYHHIVDKIMSYIESHAHDKVTLQDIADTFFFSPEHVSRLMKKSTGKTFTEILQNTKINRAKDMLINTPLKITDIAYELGFTDYRYFSQIFKKCTGMTPSQYRQKGES